MQIGVLGVNHKCAHLNFRELFAKACQKKFGPFSFMHLGHFFVLLSTCNRTEIYFSSDDLAATHSYLLKVLRYDLSEEFEHKLYSYFGYDCFMHLCRVTVGIDSAIFAETEIQGQVKTAYEAACKKFLPRQIHFMFQKCLKIGKEIRSSMIFTRGRPSLQDAIFQKAKTLFEDVKSSNFLFIGVSDINMKMFHFLKAKGINNITFCNRSREKLEKLREEEKVQILPWELKQHWKFFDIIILGTKANEYLISKENDNFRSEKKLLVDLSVPRNVDPLLESEYVKVLNIDQINESVKNMYLIKSHEMESLEAHIKQEIEKQIGMFQQKEHIREERKRISAFSYLEA